MNIGGILVLRNETKETNMETQIIIMQLNQLQRLLNNTKLDFKTAFMIIFSDYPTAETLFKINSVMLYNSNDLSEEFVLMMIKEYRKIKGA